MAPARDSSIEEVRASLLPKIGDVEGAAEIADSIIKGVFTTKSLNDLPVLTQAKAHFASMGWNQMPYDQSKALQEYNRSQLGYRGRPPLSGDEGFEIKADPEMSFLDSAGVEHKALKPGERLFEGSEQFSVGKILAAKVTGDLKGLNDFERKAISEGIGSEGGWLISEPVSAQIIDMSRNQMCVMKAGAKTINMTAPELRLVSIIGDPTAEFRKENAEITESQWELAPINLKAMSVGCLVRASREILADAQNSGTMLNSAMATSIAQAMDLATISGNGVNSPRGLDHTDGVNLIELAANGAALTDYDPFSEACEAIAGHNGIATAVLYSPRTHFALDRLKAATTNQPLTPPQSFKDLKKYHTNQIGIADTQGTASNASKAFIGDFSQVLYGIRQQVRMEMTTQGGSGTFAKVQALIRLTCRFDIAILRPSFFTKISGIIPA